MERCSVRAYRQSPGFTLSHFAQTRCVNRNPSNGRFTVAGSYQRRQNHTLFGEWWGLKMSNLSALENLIIVNELWNVLIVVYKSRYDTLLKDIVLSYPRDFLSPTWFPVTCHLEERPTRDAFAIIFFSSNWHYLQMRLQVEWWECAVSLLNNTMSQSSVIASGSFF